MSDIQPDALREALQFLIRSDLPADQKRMLIAVVMESLAQREAGVVQNTADTVRSTWSSAEVELATTHLQGKVAKTWQHADEALTLLARVLHRDARQVRSKAMELGFGAAVDFQLAKSLIRKQE
jgi:ABC-type ATPase with predicted acetyltransferase domain